MKAIVDACVRCRSKNNQTPNKTDQTDSAPNSSEKASSVDKTASASYTYNSAEKTVSSDKLTMLPPKHPNSGSKQSSAGKSGIPTSNSGQKRQSDQKLTNSGSKVAKETSPRDRLSTKKRSSTTTRRNISESSAFAPSDSINEAVSKAESSIGDDGLINADMNSSGSKRMSSGTMPEEPSNKRACVEPEPANSNGRLSNNLLNKQMVKIFMNISYEFQSFV